MIGNTPGAVQCTHEYFDKSERDFMNKFFPSVILIVIFITFWIGAPAHAQSGFYFGSEWGSEFRLVAGYGRIQQRPGKCV